MNQVEIQVCGMSRSGNHAIMDWIWAQQPGDKLLLNCAEGKTNPFETCRPLSSGIGWRASPGVDVAAARSGRHDRRDLLIHSYEDSWLGHAFSAALEEHHDEWLGPSRRRVSLLILRDPFNLFASRLKMGARLSSKVATRMWKQQAREALCGKGRLPHERRIVLYNRWCTDLDYRRAFACSLGIPFTDEGAKKVPDCGGGSSFDGTRFDGNASSMQTGQRWRIYADDQGYRDLFDEDMAEMAESLFGDMPSFARGRTAA